MNNTLTNAEFTASLQPEQDTVKAFIVILQKEQDALIQGEVENLDLLASIKVKMLKQLTSFGEQRNHYLASRGLAPDSKGMDAWLADGANSKVASIWSEALRLAKIAQQLNQTNGAIITMRLQNYQSAFDALQGAAGAATLYGPKGRLTGVRHQVSGIS